MWQDLKRAIKTPSEEYAKIGLQKRRQVSADQDSNTSCRLKMNFMTLIRPKCVTCRGETPSDVLLRGGIEYIEVRSLDINPFSPIGVDAQQVRFLDLFIVWCALADAPEMRSDELPCTRTNWNRVILEGRKPGLTLGIGCESAQFPLAQVGKDLFRELRRVAQTLDSIHEWPGISAGLRRAAGLL